MTQKTAIIVLGMHRSGTSSIAGALARLGAEPPRTPMEAADDNPRGFFESRLIGGLDDRILEAGGSWWSDWRRFDASRLQPDVLAAFRADISETVRAEFGDAATIVLKDPRLCRLWAVWDGVLESMGYRVVHVLPLRSPLEVAASLKTRNGMPIALGLALWLRHVLDAERVTRRAERRMIRWSDFMKDWRTGVATIESLVGPGVLNLDRATEVDAYLSHDLRHEIVPDEALAGAPETHAWAVEAYACLTAAAADDGAAAALKRLDLLRDRFEAASDLFGRASASAIDLERRLPEIQAEALAAEAARATGDGAVAQAVDTLRLQLAALDAQRADQQSSLEGLKAILAQERAAKANLIEDHETAMRVLALSAGVERERRLAVEERLKLSMRSLVDRETRLASQTKSRSDPGLN